MIIDFEVYACKRNDLEILLELILNIYINRILLLKIHFFHVNIINSFSKIFK